MGGSRGGCVSFLPKQVSFDSLSPDRGRIHIENALFVWRLSPTLERARGEGSHLARRATDAINAFERPFPTMLSRWNTPARTTAISDARREPLGEDRHDFHVQTYNRFSKTRLKLAQIKPILIIEIIFKNDVQWKFS